MGDEPVSGRRSGRPRVLDDSSSGYKRDASDQRWPTVCLLKRRAEKGAENDGRLPD